MGRIGLEETSPDVFVRLEDAQSTHKHVHVVPNHNEQHDTAILLQHLATSPAYNLKSSTRSWTSPDVRLSMVNNHVSSLDASKSPENKMF